MLPNRIFFTGVPGSRWSGIAQILETIPGFNTSDRTPERTFEHHSYTGHQGAYFGAGMELEAKLNGAYLDSAWATPGGTRIVKSHDWAQVLHNVEYYFPNDWIMLVYRPDLTSFAWWHEVGGFQIRYPSYTAYQDSQGMLAAIARQNKCILEYAHSKNATWHYFTPAWVENTFGHPVEIKKTFSDILVTVIK